MGAGQFCRVGKIKKILPLVKNVVRLAYLTLSQRSGSTDQPDFFKKLGFFVCLKQ
jgi:hypothetical protein